MPEVFQDPVFIFALVGLVLLGALVFLFHRGIKRLELRHQQYYDRVGSGAGSKDREEEMKRLLARDHQKKIESLEEQFRQKKIQLSTLLIKIKAITSTLDATKIIKEIMDTLKRDIGVLRAILFLADERGERIRPAEALGIQLTPDEMKVTMRATEVNLVTIAMEKRQTIAADAFHQDARLAAVESVHPLAANCKLVVPLIAENHAVGAIAIQELSRPLESEDMALLATISTLTGMALSNASDLETSKKLSEDQLRERKKLQSMFSKYVSASVVDQLLSNPDMQALGGKKQRITIMFSDIRGFTSMAEQMAPEQVVELLNEYLSKMSEIIMTWNGTLDKFMGDAIMALYGAPIMNPDDALRAVTTAVEMQRAIGAINGRRQAAGLTTIQMGIGLNTGDTVVGNIGSDVRLEYTAIGDTVNVASRLCSNAKGGQILISEATYLEIVEMVEVKVLDPIKVKGKAEPIKIFEVVRLR